VDSHYDQVMKARAASQDEEHRLYFAYSTILDRAAFDEWRNQHGYQFFLLPDGELAAALDVELVYDFPSRWWGGRVAGLADRPGSQVYGRLMKISGKDWPIIQHKEGAVTGMCIEREVTVRCAGREERATTFTTRPDRASRDGPVSAAFVEVLLRGAAAAGLPQSYLDTIRRQAR
jgi:hypothetical protein